MTGMKSKHDTVSKDLGEIILYQSEDGCSAIDVHLKDETVWLSQTQMVELFQKTKQNVSLHIRKIFKEGELQEDLVVKEYLTTAADGKRYKTKYYNLDVIISVGYRVKSKHGTRFRIWAISVLKDYLIKGYSLNQKRFEERGIGELQQAISFLSNTQKSHDLVNDEGREVAEIVNRFAGTWRLLLQYDEKNLPIPKDKHETKAALDLAVARSAIGSLKKDLKFRNEATGLFGQERGHGLAGIIGAIQQTFGGQDLYPSIEEKAAHLLYFIIKDHPFSDGNKRIGTFLFVLFLKMNGVLEKQSFDNKSLVALALLTASSDPEQKELLIRLVINLLIGDD